MASSLLNRYTACKAAVPKKQSLMSMIYLQDLVEAFEAGDPEKYTDAIAEFDSMTRLDAWKTTLLLRGKKRLQSHDEHDEPDLT